VAKKKAELKYEKYFLKDVARGTRRKEWFEDAIFIGPGHEDIIPPVAKMAIVAAAIQKPYMFHAPTHKHLFTEYFFFWGSNPYDMKEFDAEVHYTFGPEHEKHVIKKPTIVVAAPGVYHCPLNYAKVTKPFYCMELFMTSEYSGVDFGEDLTEVRVAEPDYNRYFIDTGVINTNKWGGESMALAAVPKDILPAGAGISASVTVVRSPYMLREESHKHNFTEYFYFFGSNPYDMKEFDAEVEFTFGEEKEKHVIKEPTVVVVPPGVFHCPLNFAKVSKPFYCVQVFMTSKYSFQPPMQVMPAPR
jgi:uncharacterized RmlC-like cupin family protein